MAEAPLGGRPRSRVLAQAGARGTGRQEGMGRMVHRGVQRFAVPAMFGVLAIVLAFSVFASSISAQLEPVASPVASPQTGECVPGAGDAGSAVAATPVAVDSATPAATDVADAVTAAADNVINCYNAVDVDGLVTLISGNLVADKFGGALPETLLPYTVLGYGDVNTYEDGRVGVQIQYLAGDYQYVTAIWVFVDMDGDYVLDEEVLQTSQPDGDAVIKGFSVADDLPVNFAQGGTTSFFEVVSLQGNNTSTTQRVFELYYLGAVDTATPVVDATDPSTAAQDVPGDATLVGVVSLAAGELGDIALVNAAIGNYLLVDTSDGTVANFSVTEAVEVEI